jgi:hypothetical protein
MASGLLSSFPTKEKKLKCFSPFRLYIVCTYIYAWEHPISCLIPSQLLINYSKKEKLLLCSRSIDPIDRPGLIVWILKWHQPCKYHASVRVDLPPVFCSGGVGANVALKDRRSKWQASYLDFQIPSPLCTSSYAYIVHVGGLHVPSRDYVLGSFTVGLFLARVNK